MAITTAAPWAHLQMLDVGIDQKKSSNLDFGYFSDFSWSLLKKKFIFYFYFNTVKASL